MAWESLADFFAVYHGCNNRELIKAVMRCARGRYRESLCKAAYAWHPTDTFHCALKALLLIDEQPKLYGRINLRVITPKVTRVCIELESWLRNHGYPLSKPPKPPPLQISTLWDIFNATDRYTREDIKGGIWHAMYGDYGDNDVWKPALQQYTRWHTAAGKWEQEITAFILAQSILERPEPRTTNMYNIAKRIRAWLGRSTFRSVPTLERTHG